MNIEEVPQYSRNNMQHLERVDKCGCYFCCNIFPAAEIIDFTTDETALCPHCGIDAVLPGMTNKFFLEKAMERWFTGIVEES